MASKPTFAIFVGAFHPSTVLSKLRQELEERGYPTKSSTLKTVGNAEATVEDDVALMRDEILEPLFAEGKEVVLVVHSYAGMPGSAVIKGLSKKERQARSAPGGLIGIIYMCAFVPAENQSLYQALGNQWAPWQLPDEETGLLMVPDPKPIFFPDIPDEEASECVALLQGHSIKALQAPVSPLGFRDEAFKGRVAYIRALEDAAIPLLAQDAMIEASGVEWIIKDLPMGHSPFLVDPKRTAQAIIEIAEEFVTVR